MRNYKRISRYQMLGAIGFSLLLLLGSSEQLEARIRLKDICRVKGQEENTLQGLGLVIGLKGTGDGGGSLPMIRNLARMMQLMGSPIGSGGAMELKDTKNVALVMVTATIPPAGARQGDQIECVVSSIGSAKSLVGGQLVMTPLMGPVVNSTQIYAFAQGPLHVEDTQVPTVAKIHRGCRLEEEFRNQYHADGKFTLVIDENHADFEVAQEIADLINKMLSDDESTWNENKDQSRNSDDYLARPLDAVNVEITIPPYYDAVDFIGQVLSITIAEPQVEARVYINQRDGGIFIRGDVEIAATVISHKNIQINTGNNLPLDRFVPLDPSGTQTARLKALVEALNAVKVPADDQIQIIKGLEKARAIHGKVIVE